MASLTPAKCIQSCKSKGYLFAGVQHAFQCFCGNVAPPQSTIVSRDECNTPCRGDSSLKCGGAWRMNVFGISGMISVNRQGRGEFQVYFHFEPQTCPGEPRHTTHHPQLADQGY